MITHNLTQGSPEWLAYRADPNRHNASEAAAMLGMDPNCKRSELLRAKHVGLSREFSDFMRRRVLDEGHRFEALARPLAEKIIGETLYSLVGSDGWDSASFDGLTLAEDVDWEHKSLSDELRLILPAEGVGGPEVGACLPAKHRIQMESQCKVSKADRALFTASKWTAEGTLIEARHCWYEPDAELRADILRGWAQFDIDLAAYVLPPLVEQVIAAPMATLPAVSVRMDGVLVVHSNLVAVGAALREFIGRIPAQPKTDLEFATAKAACKALKRVEDELDATEAAALASIEDVNEMRRLKAELHALARTTRLAREKDVERRERQVKEDAVLAACRALDLHIEVVNAELAPMRLLPVPADFAGSIKGLRSIDSMQDALETALAGAKIAADGQARGIRANVAAFKAAAEGLEFLFADLGSVIHKAADDFGALMQSRIAAHRAAEAAREAKRQADEATRIAQAEQRAREQEATRIAAAVAAEAEMARKAADAEAQRIAEVQDAQRRHDVAEQVLLARILDIDRLGAPAQPAAPVVLPMPPAVARASVPASAEPATLNLGDICGRLGFTVSGAFLGNMLDVWPAANDKNAKLYTETQFQTICRRLSGYVGAVAASFKTESEK